MTKPAEHKINREDFTEEWNAAVRAAQRNDGLRVALPAVGCEDCGYAPTDDWTGVPGFPKAVEIERIRGIPCPYCVNGNPTHNAVDVTVFRSLFACHVAEAIARGEIPVDATVEDVALRSGGNIAVHTDAFVWTFKRESMRLPMPADTTAYFHSPGPKPMRADYKPLTPEGERELARKDNPAYVNVHLDTFEAMYWVLRREPAGGNGGNISIQPLAPNVVFRVPPAASTIPPPPPRNTSEPKKPRIIDLNVAPSGLSKKQREVIEGLRHTQERRMVVEERKLLDLLSGKAATEKVQSMSSKSRRSLASSLREDIRKIVNDAKKAIGG